MHHMHAQLKAHICAPYTHTCTTKYNQNIRYTQLAFPLYSMKHQVQMRDLCWTSCFWCFSLCFSLFRWKLQCFSWKLLLFMKTATLHENHCFSWKLPLFMKTAMVFIVSFWVITKYRSFVRKTKNRTMGPWNIGKTYIKEWSITSHYDWDVSKDGSKVEIEMDAGAVGDKGGVG